MSLLSSDLLHVVDVVVCCVQLPAPSYQFEARSSMEKMAQEKQAEEKGAEINFQFGIWLVLDSVGLQFCNS